MSILGAWWRDLIYAWDTYEEADPGIRLYGLRPWRGAPFFGLAIDRANRHGPRLARFFGSRYRMIGARPRSEGSFVWLFMDDAPRGRREGRDGT